MIVQIQSCASPALRGISNSNDLRGGVHFSNVEKKKQARRFGKEVRLIPSLRTKMNRTRKKKSKNEHTGLLLSRLRIILGWLLDSDSSYLHTCLSSRWFSRTVEIVC